jgi:hypothetical protein
MKINPVVQCIFHVEIAHAHCSVRKMSSEFIYNRNFEIEVAY